MKQVFVSIAVLSLAACSGNSTNDSPATIEIPPAPAAGTATAATLAANTALANRLPLTDRTDFENAERGHLASIEAPAIYGEDGNVVWKIDQFDFLNADAPATVNPSLWRQAQLVSKHGLFEVMDGIWQVRGYDLSVMTIIRGKTGWIIVDPLTNTETAKASLQLANDTLGERPVSAVLYTHSHGDHFGGVRGVISEADIEERGAQVVAPHGFSEEAVSENVLAGNHMSRRATLMFGSTLPRSATGHVSSGLGPGLPQGTISLILPTEEIPGPNATRIIDGITFEFIDAAGTEAPAEFMFYLPEFKALCTAEVATGTFHNVLTPRGAKARNALTWSQVIDDVLQGYAGKSDVVFASHHWPVWESENVTDFLSNQRDIYRYVHDATLKAANAGSGMVEAAETVAEPEFSQTAFNTRGYYGTLNHNAKAVYQYYFGWWSGVPADYHRLPPEQAGARYVKALGGADNAIQKGIEAYEAGDYRWAAELLNHVVFADGENQMARDWLAATYEQMAYQAESGAWRSYFLAGAQELRTGVPAVGGLRTANLDVLKAVPARLIFDSMATRFNAGKSQMADYDLRFVFPDSGEDISVAVSASTVIVSETAKTTPTVTLTMDRPDFNALIAGTKKFPELMATGALKLDGNPAAAGAFLGALDTPEFWFPVATP